MSTLLGIGFASGLPYVLVNDTMNAWMSAVKINVSTIGLFSLIGLPYTLKFLWAPLLDRFLPPGLADLGRRRGWLVLLQAMIATGLLALAFAGPQSASDDLTAFAVLGMAVVFLSASQDIVADAYRTDIVQHHELGAGAAAFVTGYRIAMIIGGTAAMYVAGKMGWQAAYIMMAMLMCLTIAASILAPQTSTAFVRPQSIAEAVVEPIRDFVRVRGFWAALFIVLFAIVFRMPDLLAQRMTMPLLLSELSFTPEDVAWVRQLLGFFLTVVGALIGGGIIAKHGLMRSLIVFGVLQVASNAGFWFLSINEPDLALMAIVIAIENFCGGLVAAGFVAFLMSCCNRTYSATQYALLSACMALASSIGGALTGYVVIHIEYNGFFLVTMIAGIPGLIMLIWLPRTLTAEQRRE